METQLIENDFTVGVTFRHSARAAEFRCNHLDLRVGDACVVDTERGPCIGTVNRSRIRAEGRRCHKQLRNVLRKASPRDIEVDKRNIEKEKEIYRGARQKIKEQRIRMKLSQVEVTFDEKRAIIYFTSEDRVDFREMVKQLAAECNVRIEMRQVGVRDEAKQLGGHGICGVKLCCSSFLADFAPVSIKMAKDQNLSLNPVKISGVCGRLMCCLTYEQDFYKEMQKIVPRTGKTVITPEGRGKVLVADFLRQRVTVIVEGEKGIMVFEAAQVQLAFPPQQQQQKRPGGPPQQQDGKRRDRDNRDRDRDRGPRPPREEQPPREGQPPRPPQAEKDLPPEQLIKELEEHGENGGENGSNGEPAAE
ncbi:MAG: hypothetical protein HZA03_05280 [Nitrospinae bacterium]|nr:hypothetical protein [Nitrospinota bacterium]